MCSITVPFTAVNWLPYFDSWAKTRSPRQISFITAAQGNKLTLCQEFSFGILFDFCAWNTQASIIVNGAAETGLDVPVCDATGVKL
jgi:hypothetical protein